MLCGIDEAGRGPLAGPVYAAAVVLPAGFDISVLNDSKKLSEKKREYARKIILRDALFWGIGAASCEEIDAINILQATMLAMRRAFEELFNRKKFSAFSHERIDVVVDGNKSPELLQAASCKTIIKGDSICPEIMAASILAKTFRDRVMLRYSWIYPEYGFEKHKGYGTRGHIEAIKLFGPSPIQRKTFAVKE